MAGIGFELLNLMKRGTYLSLARAYGLTTLMVSGPFLFILMGIGIVYCLILLTAPDSIISHQFISIIIYLFSTSMILSSLLQYTFFRFIADKIFTKEFDQIAPNFNGVLFIQIILCICVSLPIVFYFFKDYDFILKVLLISIFIILCLIWLSTVLLTGLKSYNKIIWAFAIGYSSMIISNVLLKTNTIPYLLCEFLLTQTLILLILLNAILSYYPSRQLIKFEFLQNGNFYLPLVCANFFYTLGIWIDKYLFWFNPSTSFITFSPLRFSAIYDPLMFVAYLTTIPTTAAYLLQIEAKFALIYPNFMQTIFRRKTLAEIDAIQNQLVVAGRACVFSLFKTQLVITIVFFLSVSFVFSIFNINPLYLNLLLILIIGAGLNVILWGLLNILYYLTKYTQALYVTFFFCLSNFVFTLFSLHAGPLYYGYGFNISLLLSIILGLIFLNESFENLEYSTFMMTD